MHARKARLDVGEETLDGGYASCDDAHVEHDLRPDSRGNDMPGSVLRCGMVVSMECDKGADRESWRSGNCQQSDER